MSKPRAPLATLLLFGVLVACAHVPDNSRRAPSWALRDTGDTALAHVEAAARQEAAGPPGAKSGFLMLPDGLDAFVARVTLARLAERSLDVQYYLYHGDFIGMLLTDALLEAADRGVRVRILVDDMDFASRDRGLALVNAHPHVEIRIFNPFNRKTPRAVQYVTQQGSVTRRMHNKSFTADNRATIVGGRNIGNEYFTADPAIAFADLDVLALGPIAKEVSQSFDEYWNSDLAYPVNVLMDEQPSSDDLRLARREVHVRALAAQGSAYVSALRDSRLARAMADHTIVLSWGDARVIYDSPQKLQYERGDKRFQLMPQLTPYVNGLRSELTVFTPYFVPGDSGTALLTSLVARGVRVRVLTNSLASNDVPAVHAGYAAAREPLLRGGVELYELDPRVSAKKPSSLAKVSGSSSASLHAKSFVFDRRQVFIGSLNLDPRSVDHNTEIGIIIDSPEIARAMADWFDRRVPDIAFTVKLHDGDLVWQRTAAGAPPQTFDHDPLTSCWARFKVDVLRLLPIESQL
jgi:putative cardiolipin synthase